MQSPQHKLPIQQGSPQPPPANDVLGVQSLASMAFNQSPASSPLPMFGGPMMMPGLRYPIPPFGGLPLSREAGPSPLIPPLWPGSGMPPTQRPSFAPMLNAPNLFCEPRPENLNPWLHMLDPRFPPPGASSNPLPIPAKNEPASPDLLDEGSPITPPNLQHNFHFQN